ncbi:MAG TPA: NTP transferase domain-containing protein, partial [Acidimicrobiales bacterium]|nr:NTP transferase domain-containing protein [Acidimicrobiales bacterium]
MAVVLAAGEGSRFAASGDAGHKLLAELRGRPVVVWAVEAAVDAGLATTIVVEGAVALGDVLREAGLIDRVTVVPNERWSEGQAGSLARGLAAADAAGAGAAVVGLGDQPLVG